MIVNANRLVRDKSVPITSGGLVGRLNYAHLSPHDNDNPSGKMWEGVADIGATIPAVELPLVKTTELCEDAARQPVVIERLCFDTGSALIPYRVTQRNAAEKTSAIIPRNLSTIHAKLRNERHPNLVFIDPRRDFLNAASNCAEDAIPADQSLIDEICDYVDDEDRQKFLPADLLASAAFTQEATLDAVAPVPILLQRAKGLKIADLVKTVFKPPLIRIDALTAQAMVDGALPYDRVRHQWCSSASIATDPARPLRLDKPEDTVIVADDQYLLRAAQGIDESNLTDFDVRFFMNAGGLQSGRHVVSMVDRYAGILGDAERMTGAFEMEMYHLEAIADELAFYAWTRLGEPDARLRLVKTNNDEALVEVYDKGGTTVAFSAYFDLAKIALGAMGAVTLGLK